MIRAILTSGSMRSLRHKPDRSCATKPGHISCHRHDTVDDVDASTPVIEAEIATEIVNQARAMVQKRIAQLVEEGDEAEADRLRATAAQPLFHLLRSIDDRNEA